MSLTIYVADAQGRRNPPSWYINPEILQVMDTNQTRHLLHELTQMEAQFAEYELQGLSFPELGAVEAIASGFDYVAYKQKVKDGRAEFLSRSATDFPKITNGMRPHTSPVIPIGIGFDVNYFEQQAAQRFGMSIDAEGMMDCAEYIDQKLDEAWHLGGLNPEGLEIKGMFDYFNGGGQAQLDAGTTIYKSTLSTGAGGNTWALKTGAEILVDVATGVEDVFKNSRKKARCRKIALGFTPWAELGKKNIVDDNGSIVKLRPYLQATYPDITWIVDPYFDAINFDQTPNETWNGAAGSGAVLFYDDSPNTFKFRANRREILRPYEHKGFTTTVNTFGLTAGIQMRRTYGLTYMKGIS